MGDQFAQGIVFYAGSRALPVGDPLRVRPHELLWRSWSGPFRKCHRPLLP